MQASLPRFFSGFFFGVLRTLAELRSADCRFGILYVGDAVFSAEKTSGFRAAALDGITPAAAGYTSSEALRAPPSPQGEGFFVVVSQKASPRGEAVARKATDEV